MLENIEVLYHSSIKLNKEQVLYIDPFKIDKDYKDADIIFITHNHYDHYSEEAIDKVKKENTIIVIPEMMLLQVSNKGFKKEQIIAVKSNMEYCIGNIKFETIPAYNINKEFHQKANDWVGYVINLQGIRYYIAGDTDMTEENKQVKCDVALVPVGGTYTMNFEEAAELVNEIKPQIAIPTHYGSVVGTNKDAQEFIKLLKPTIQGEILMK